MLKEDKLIASQYDTICESKYAKVALRALDRVPSLLRELKGIKSNYDAIYQQWLQANNVEDTQEARYDFFREEGRNHGKVDKFFNNIITEFDLDAEGVHEDEFLADLESFLLDYVINGGNVPMDVLDGIALKLLLMLEETQTPYPTKEFAKEFYNFVKKYPQFADGSGYSDAIIHYKQWPGTPVNENVQKKARKLQQMLDKEEIIKAKVTAWNNALNQAAASIDDLYKFSSDPDLKAYYDYCAEKYNNDENSLTPEEEKFFYHANGVDENLMDEIRHIGFDYD